MGQVFQRSYKAADGTLRTCKTWTIRYYRAGRAYQEPTKYTDKTRAKNLLKQREGDIAHGKPVTSDSTRYAFVDAVTDITADYTANRRRSQADMERRIRLHLAPWFGGRKLAEITTLDVRRYTQARLAAGAKPGGVNRELAILKRMFSLAIEANVLHFKPAIPMLDEDNVRAGFVDDEQIAAIVAALPAAVRPVIRVAYVTGWRTRSELLPLEWRHVDRDAGEIRLDPGTTKNRQARVFPFTATLRALFADLWTEHEALAKRGILCPYVFQRNGKRILDIRRAWERATVAAGCPGRIVHDLRRSAIRNMERSGMSRSVAMQLSGHETEAVFRRYAITSDADLQEAVRRLDRDSFGTVDANRAG